MAMTELEREGVAQRLLRLTVSLFPMLDVRRLDDTWPALLSLLVFGVRQEFDKSAKLAAVGYMAERSARLGTKSVTPAVLSDDVVLDFLPDPDPDFDSLPDVSLVFDDFVAEPVTFGDEDEDRLRTSLTVAGPVRYKQAISRGDTDERAARAALVGIQGVATRTALAGDVRTTLEAVAEDPEVSGWARIPRPDACPFCLLLATRGGAYRSRETALKTTSKAARGAGHSFHDHCRCMVIPIFEDSWYPPAHVAHAEEVYGRATRGKSGKEARKAFSDAINEERSAGRTA